MDNNIQYSTVRADKKIPFSNMSVERMCNEAYIFNFKIIGKCLPYVKAKRPNNLRTLNDTGINFYRRHQLYFLGTC